MEPNKLVSEVKEALASGHGTWAERNYWLQQSIDLIEQQQREIEKQESLIYALRQDNDFKDREISRLNDWIEECNEEYQSHMSGMQREIERLQKIDFPRQPNRVGEWVITPNYLELVEKNMNNYHGDDAADYIPSWEQIEMVLLAVERMRTLSPKEDTTND